MTPRAVLERFGEDELDLADIGGETGHGHT